MGNPHQKIVNAMECHLPYGTT